MNRHGSAPDRTAVSRHRLAGLTARLRDRGDSEHEMSLNRFAIDLIIISLMVAARPAGEAAALATMAVHLVCAAALLGHIMINPRRCPTRRAIAMTLDLGTVSLQLYFTGPVGAALYPVYLWVILGNGFRFGVRYLFAAMAMAVAGFSLAIEDGVHWQGQPYLAGGLLLGLLVIPLYASTLILKLSAAKAVAERASQAKTLFLASVSHELRTPLNAIIGMGGLFGATSLDREQREMATTIDSAAKALLQQIDSILDFTRIESGHFAAELSDFDLLAEFDEVRAAIAPLARAKRLRLALHVPADTLLLVRADQRHLRTILVNLLGNAVKFTDAGSVTLSVRTVHPTASGALLRFEVSDTGIGIAAGATGHIFDRFTQADETIRNRFGGTGLGLAICKLLVGLLGGQIGVDSTPGRGSLFWFTMPVFDGQVAVPPPVSPTKRRAVLLEPLPGDTARWLARAQLLADAGSLADPAVAQAGVMYFIGQAAAGPGFAAWFETAVAAGVDPLVAVVLGSGEPEPASGAQRTMIRTSIGEGAGAGEWQAALRIMAAWHDPSPDAQAPVALHRPARPLNILVADDNVTNRRVVGKILTTAGHRASFVPDGPQALAALAEHDFDLALMDVNMPGMTGIEVTQLHRFAELGGGRLPILALTADATAELARRCLDAGMDACIVKPVSPNQLLETIDAHAIASPEARLPPAGEPCPNGFAPDAHAPDSFAVTWDVPSHPVIEWTALNGLRALGGEQFVIELIEEFNQEAEELRHRLAAAIRAGDAEAFRADAHALQSTAANIGAKALSELCRSWRHTKPAELQTDGEDRMRHLGAAVSDVQWALVGSRTPTPPPPVK